MNKEILHIVRNEFTRNIQHPDKWWNERLKIYEYYCLKSIKNQTNKNFLLLMDLEWVPDHIQEKIKKILEKSNLEFVIRDVKRISLKDSLKNYLKHYKFVYNTRIDSDDLFHEEVIDEIQSHDIINRHAYVYQKGYCYDSVENKLRHYFMPSPPFSTIVYPMKIYLDEEKQQQYRIFKSHDTLVHNMPYTVLSENKFIVNAHSTNRITTYFHNYKIPKKYNFQNEINKSEINNILKNFGISDKIYKNKILKI